MNEDPFNDVKAEVLQQTAVVKKLHGRWKELMANPSSKKEDGEFGFTLNELQGILQAITWDLADLSETIRIVESNRGKFRISEAELKSRKQFIDSTKSEIETIKKEINSPTAKAMANRLTKGHLMSGGDMQSRLNHEIEMDNDQYIQSQLNATREMEKEQEKYLESIHQSVNTIEQVGLEMEDELGRQNVILDQLGDMAENTGNRIRRTMKDIDRFIDQSSNTVSWGIIGVLCLVVFILFWALVSL
jgi:flagellar motor switch/type III secretory pathway protein FliN